MLLEVPGDWPQHATTGHRHEQLGHAVALHHTELATDWPDARAWRYGTYLATGCRGRLQPVGQSRRTYGLGR